MDSLKTIARHEERGERVPERLRGALVLSDMERWLMARPTYNPNRLRRGIPNCASTRRAIESLRICARTGAGIRVA